MLSSGCSPFRGKGELVLLFLYFPEPGGLLTSRHLDFQIGRVLLDGYLYERSLFYVAEQQANKTVDQ